MSFERRLLESKDVDLSTLNDGHFRDKNIFKDCLVPTMPDVVGKCRYLYNSPI